MYFFKIPVLTVTRCITVCGVCVCVRTCVYATIHINTTIKYEVKIKLFHWSFNFGIELAYTDPNQTINKISLGVLESHSSKCGSKIRSFKIT